VGGGDTRSHLFRPLTTRASESVSCICVVPTESGCVLWMTSHSQRVCRPLEAGVDCRVASRSRGVTTSGGLREQARPTRVLCIPESDLSSRTVLWASMIMRIDY
jgi:hypothetical protein